jgi:hypothetical protein
MTPKEKATELYQKYYNNYGYYGIPVDAVKHSKECANICIDEILKSQPIEPNKSKPFGVKIQSVRQNFTDADEYWKLVKQELELL